ncbi:MAG TPA: phosphatase PAP2 family protein, partial [Polyangia bacterium]|nr:phosphatase PAP2 family protein [Polyangia bacterium]
MPTQDRARIVTEVRPFSLALRRLLIAGVLVAIGARAPAAAAQAVTEEPPASADAPAAASETEAAPPPAAEAPAHDMRPVADPFPDPVRRSAPHLRDNEHFMVDPVVDGVLIGGGFSFSILLTRILGTGELRPQAPGDYNRLLSIDRVAVTQTIDGSAGTRSDIGLWAAYGYAILDPILSGVRDGRRALLVDAIMYSEAIAITQAFTLATKIGVRRPRPVDYLKCSGANAGAAGCDATDLQLSFFSGHASATGTVAGLA